MNNTLFTISHPQEGDIETVLQLMQDCEVHTDGSSDSYLQELKEDWEKINLEKDIWIARSTEERLMAYAAIYSWGSKFHVDLFIHPEVQESTLGSDLLSEVEKRAKELLDDLEDGTYRLIFYPSHKNERECKLLEEYGCSVEKYVFNFQYALEKDVPEISLPQGVVIRQLDPEDDYQVIHKLVQEEFDRPGRDPQPFDKWKENMVDTEIFDPQIWYLAIYKNEIIGVCLCFDYPNEGWIRQLAVKNDWRKKGLGKALMHTAFRAFKGRGKPNVGLAVESDNPNAFQFYEASGMRRTRQYDEYSKSITK